jgi:hypothetical protein
MYLRAADESGLRPRRFSRFGQLTEAENQRASEPLINEVMPTLLGASKSDDPGAASLGMCSSRSLCRQGSFQRPKPLC